MPAQPVDATPSNALIRQCFPRRSDLFGCTRSKPSQGSVPADLTLASDLAFVFKASRVRLECCVDPLKPPWITGHWEITSDRSSDAWKITAGAIGLATLVHFDTQLRRNDLFKIIQGLVYLRKHAFARGFAKEFRDSEKILASFDLHAKVIHEI